MKVYLSVSESVYQSVITQVLGGKLTLLEACERLGCARNTFWRKIKRYRQFGSVGLVHQSRGRPSNACLDAAIKQAVLEIWLKDFAPYGFGVRHFYRKAHHRFPKQISYWTVLKWLKDAGHYKQTRKGWRHHSRRPRREAFGELVQMDTSIHDWLDWGKNIALIANMDDCTNQILDAHLQLTDTTLGNMQVMKQTLERYGMPEAFYVDKAPVFKVTRTGGPGRINQPKFGTPYQTQIQRALETLGVELIFAHSPQAKGRIERSFGTWQNNLIPELRQNGIVELGKANAYIQEVYIPEHNRLFAKDPTGVRDLFVPILDVDLNYILCEQYTHRVTNDHVIKSKRGGYELKILPDDFRTSYAKAKVDVYRHVDYSITVKYKGKPLNYKHLN
jgi:hypothetical protein